MPGSRKQRKSRAAALAKLGGAKAPTAKSKARANNAIRAKQMLNNVDAEIEKAMKTVTDKELLDDINPRRYQGTHGILPYESVSQIESNVVTTTRKKLARAKVMNKINELRGK